MATELKGLTKRSENYSQWYNELVVKADLAEQAPVRGCMVIKPYGYAIWEKIQRTLDDKFKETGERYPAKVWSADGYFHTDVRYSLGALSSSVNPDSIKGHTIILPENPQNGEKLDDCHITGPGFELNTTNIVLATDQSVTTNAGTYDCICVDYTDEARVIFVKVTAKSKQWWKLGVGAVKYESYDKKGRMTLNRELYSIE